MSMNSESHFLSSSHVTRAHTSPYTPFKSAGCPNHTPKRRHGQGSNTPRRLHAPKISTSSPDAQLLLPELELLSEASISVRLSLYLHIHANILQESDQTQVSPQKIHCSFRITQLKRSSLHLEKQFVTQRILEHEVSLQVLKERMEEIEKDIDHSTTVVGTMHSYMDQVGIPIPDMPEQVASAILCSEVRLSHISDYHAT